MNNSTNGKNLLDEQKDMERLMAHPPEHIDPFEIKLAGTEGKAKLQVQRFWITDLGVRVVISLMINWEIGEGEDEDDCFVGEYLEYPRDTVDLWSAADRERFIKHCQRRLKQVSYLTSCWWPVTNPEDMDYGLFGLEDRIQMSIS